MATRNVKRSVSKTTTIGSDKPLTYVSGYKCWDGKSCEIYATVTEAPGVDHKYEMVMSMEAAAALHETLGAMLSKEE